MSGASEAILSPVLFVERRFFSILRWFGLILTAMALLCALLFGGTGLSKVTRTVDEHLHRPTASYADFQRTLDASASSQTGAGADSNIQRKEQEVARAQAELEFAKKLQPHLDAIVASLSAYATAVDVGKPSAEAVGNFVRQTMAGFRMGKDDGLAWGYVEGLEKATADLAADGGRLAKLGAQDAHRAQWDQFLQWYSLTYREQIGLEERRIQTERSAAQNNAGLAMVDFYMAAAAFAVFVAATILLVLLRIERNTRQA